MSIEAFLAWEDAQPTRFEFDGFHVHAMTGGSADHAAVQANLIAALVGRLRGTSCRAFGSELKIITAGSVRYPDAFVTCAPVQGKATASAEPVVVFEIISPSTSGVDRIIKNQEYPRHVFHPALCDPGTGPAGRHGIQPGSWRLGRSCDRWRCGTGYAGNRHIDPAGRTLCRDGSGRGPAGIARSSRVTVGIRDIRRPGRRRGLRQPGRFAARPCLASRNRWSPASGSGGPFVRS